MNVSNVAYIFAHKQLSELTTAPISSFSDYNRNFDTKDLSQ